MSYSLELIGVTKKCGNVLANDGVNLRVKQGTIHALIGENGAGKSTAMKILFGLYQPDRGEVRIRNQSFQELTPETAAQHGVGMVHQHFMLAESETVLDNLTLGYEKRKFGVWKNRKAEESEALALMNKTGLILSLEKKVGDLSVGMKSRLEILKVLYRRSEILILDEPTATLTPQEIESFLQTLLTLKSQGKTILIVTHKLKEVMAVADEVTVLRKGKSICTVETNKTSAEELSETMIGKKISLPRAGAPRDATEMLYEIPAFGLKLHVGEIIGIAGVEGNGQDELVASVLQNTPKNFSFIPSDRHQEGLVLNFKLYENLRLSRRRLSGQHPLHFFPETTTQEKQILSQYDVRPASPELAASALSGGNQQKLILGRELHLLPEKSLILAVHPTRGVDIGAIEFIHRLLLESLKKKAAVLLISSELEELMSLSHRIHVMYKNRICSEFKGPNYNEQDIGKTMLTGGPA